MEEKQNINQKDENLFFIDPLENPAELKNAIIHGRSQLILNEKAIKEAGGKKS
jgi:hypothetical protein